MNTTNCTCKNQACQTRIARGLAPFCQLSRDISTPPAGYATRDAAAAARKPGQTIVGIRGGFGHAPTRYFLRGKA